MMSNRSFFIVLALATCSIVGIVIVQSYWFNRAFNVMERQFDYEVNSALLNVTGRLCDANRKDLSLDRIEKLSSNYYMVNLKNSVPLDVLEPLLYTEFEKVGVNERFEYALFDCSDQSMIYGSDVGLVANNVDGYQSSFPVVNKDDHYFGVLFPDISSNVSEDMEVWMFSTLVLLLVVIFFLYALFIIFQQKRLSEVHKDFVSSMTHEFKTPIASIQLASEATLKSLGNKAKQEQYLGIIQVESERLEKQVDRVLGVTRMESKTVDLKLDTCDVRDLVDQASDRVGVMLTERRGKIIFDRPSSPMLVKVDIFHFVNSIVNLLDNAIKYCHENPYIKIQTKVHHRRLIISFFDNGVGIKKSMIDRIFKKFYRIPSQKVHNVRGFGLGLAYVKTVVEAHRGKVMAQSNLSGTEFIISMPYETER